MKTQTAWNELKHYLRKEGYTSVINLMATLEDMQEPEYVYRLAHKDYAGKWRGDSRIGTAFRIKCILNSGRRYYNKARRDDFRIERATTVWTDVTEDFSQWLG